ncbi:hypothetical protein [Xylanimonas protaetiae]|uniref:Uncharacterized protein n=1 Tax=Xylanimonas protaetiae TaxID=2509457 RepID=A0A4P6F0V8_9MICO|nr:hypothetical protein [Xylanimonas protaetiae]QAY69102.1 hypothetical protein ET471_02795 [Xylanimonas protaetiae]
MGGNGTEQDEVTEVVITATEVVVTEVVEEESFVEKMERAARGELGASPVDDPDRTGEDRFDAG